MNKHLIIILLLITVAALSGCKSHNGKLDGEITSDPAGRINTNKIQSDAEKKRNENPELYKALEDGFNDELVIINNYTMPLGYSNAERIILTRNRYVIKYGLIKELLPKATQKVKKKAEQLYPSRTIDFSVNINYPDWQYLAASLPYAADEIFLLYDIIGLEISVDLSVNNLAVLKITNKVAPIEDFAMTRAKEQDAEFRANTYLDIRFTYAYMKSVYDKNGNEYTTPQEYEFDEQYIDTLQFPLKDVPNFRDTWEQGRSNNTRKHMGTDIRNPEGSELYSCGDGKVIFKGSSSIPGNYLIIRDNKGYEYHYYHLVEIPSEVNIGDEVKKGQLICHVGNTGNSVASHLHISIIEPNGAFVNPYDLMKTLSKRTLP